MGKFIFMVTIAIAACALTNGVNATQKKTLVEQRIARAMNGLLPESPIENQFGAPASVEDRMAFYHTPGVSIAVINENQIEWARGFGVMEHGKKARVTDKTLFQAASISKPVFALAVMKLVHDQKLKLDEDVNTYLQTWKVPKSGDWQPRITLRQLLSHSAGLNQPSFPGYLRSQKLPSVAAILNGKTPANTGAVVVNILPGTQMRYSGGGTTIAQQAVVDQLKRPFPEIMNELVLSPLGLSDSTYEQPLPKKLHQRAATAHFQNSLPVSGRFHVYPEMAAAGLWTTPSDLAKLGLELQATLMGKSMRLLTKKSLEEMLLPTASDAMGIGFFLRGEGDHVRFMHTGANEGFRAAAVFYRNRGQGVVIMMNSNSGDLLFEIERAIAKEYGWPGYFADERKVISIAPKKMRKLIGTYATKEGTRYEVSMSDDRLYLTLIAQAPIEIVPETPTKFFMRGLNTSISFDKKEMTILQSGNEIKATKNS